MKTIISREKLTKEKIVKAIFLLAVAVEFVFFVRRLFYGIDVTDEVFNICDSFRLVSGNKLLVDIWEYYQTGDSFLAPFVWVYWKINGSTEGIVLACRLFYLFLNIVIASFAYWVLKDYFENFYARMAVSLVIIFYAPFSLYYLYYDTAGQLFFLLGVLCLLKQNKNSQKRWSVLAGLFHACMIFAYPTAIVVAFVEFVIWCIWNIKKKQSRYIGLYACGAGIFGIVLFIYCVSVQFNLYLFDNPKSRVYQTDFTRNLKTGLQVNDYRFVFGKNGSISDKLVDVVKSIGALLDNELSIYALLVMLIVIVVLMLDRFKKITWPSKTLFTLMPLAIVYISKNGIDIYNRAVIIYYFYFVILLLACFLFIPGVIRQCPIIILIVVLPSIVFMIVVGITARSGGTKSVMGLWVACIIGVGMYVDQYKGNISERLGCIYRPIIVLMLSSLAVYMFYFQYFQDNYNGRYELTRKVEEGIYKGLYASAEDEKWLMLENEIKMCVDDNDETVAIFDNQTCFKFLALEKTIHTAYAPETYQFVVNGIPFLTFRLYWDRFGCPDVVIINDEPEWYDEATIESIPNSNYQLRKHTEHYLVYENVK